MGREELDGVSRQAALISGGQWEWAAERYREGYTLRELEVVLGLAPAVIRSQLRELGVPMRPGGKRAKGERPALPPLKLMRREVYARWAG